MNILIIWYMSINNVHEICYCWCINYNDNTKVCWSDVIKPCMNSVIKCSQHVHGALLHGEQDEDEPDSLNSHCSRYSHHSPSSFVKYSERLGFEQQQSLTCLLKILMNETTTSNLPKHFTIPHYFTHLCMIMIIQTCFATFVHWLYWWLLMEAFVVLTA